MKARSVYSRLMIAPLLSVAVSGSLAAAAMADAAPRSSGARLSVTGAAAPRHGGSSQVAWVPGHKVLLPDGGFENGPPPNSGWTEMTTTTCEWIQDPSGAWGIPAHRGTYAFWAGGYCGGAPSSDLVRQDVMIRATHPTLKLFVVYYRVDADDPPDTDTFYVRVNNTLVFQKAMTLANNTFPNWTLETIDLSAYAGMTVRLTIGGRSTGSLTGNVLVDDVHFDH